MIRKSTVKIPTKFGTLVADVKFNMCGRVLNRDEQQKVVDNVTDEVVNALRNAPYAGNVPLRAVQIS